MSLSVFLQSKEVGSDYVFVLTNSRCIHVLVNFLSGKLCSMERLLSLLSSDVFGRYLLEKECSLDINLMSRPLSFSFGKNLMSVVRCLPFSMARKVHLLYRSFITTFDLSFCSLPLLLLLLETLMLLLIWFQCDPGQPSLGGCVNSRQKEVYLKKFRS